MRGLLLLAQLAAAAEAVRVHSTGEEKAAATGTASRRVLQSDSEESVVGGSAGWGDWASQDDRVMGGVSVSTMVATGSDAIFSGNLRLDSNGGFASVSTSFRADVRAFGGLRVNFFPSSRRLLMYVNSSTLGAIRDLAIRFHQARRRYLRLTDAGMQQYSAAMYIPSISEAGGSSELSLVLPWTSFFRQVDPASRSASVSVTR